MYLLKSKGRALVMRDGEGSKAPAYNVGPVDWVLFDNLPLSVPLAGDGDVDVKVADKNKLPKKSKSLKEIKEARIKSGILTYTEKRQKKDIAKMEQGRASKVSKAKAKMSQQVSEQ